MALSKPFGLVGPLEVCATGNSIICSKSLFGFCEFVNGLCYINIPIMAVSAVGYSTEQIYLYVSLFKITTNITFCALEPYYRFLFKNYLRMSLFVFVSLL